QERLRGFAKYPHRQDYMDVHSTT
ncbi:hypothetical protein CFC21_109372, partial [Triticum aestivum]